MLTHLENKKLVQVGYSGLEHKESLLLAEDRLLQMVLVDSFWNLLGMSSHGLEGVERLRAEEDRD